MTLIEISSASIHKAIDHNLHVVNSTLRSQRIRLRRADDLISAHEFLSSSSKLIHPARLNEVVENVIPIYIILEKQAGDTFDVCGTSLFTLGYSTWKGRVMNLDLFLAENHNHGNIMMQCLAKIAKLLDCTRIVHLVSFCGMILVCPFYKKIRSLMCHLTEERRSRSETVS